MHVHINNSNKISLEIKIHRKISKVRFIIFDVSRLSVTNNAFITEK